MLVRSDSIVRIEQCSARIKAQEEDARRSPKELEKEKEKEKEKQKKTAKKAAADAKDKGTCISPFVHSTAAGEKPKPKPKSKDK